MNTAALRALLPSRRDYSQLRTTWRRDAIAGLSVAVVALPLALAFGITSGMGAAAGIVTAIIGGLVAAIFGGSHLQVSGPTGAMAVVLAPIVAAQGVSAALIVSILAGIILLVGGVLGWGRLVTFIPWPVVEGFTLGIAVIIVMQQIPFLTQVKVPTGMSTLAGAVYSLTHVDTSVLLASLAVFAVAVVCMLAVPLIHRSAPASLIAVIAATIAALLLSTSVAVIGALPTSVPMASLSGLSLEGLRPLVTAAIAVAALAGIESLLSARVADGMSNGDRVEPDRELFGQGLASVASGLLGGMPATGAIARTAVNVRSGARTRVAAIVHSVALLAIIVAGASLVAVIPLVALAGVLAVTAYRMVSRRAMKSILRSTRSDALVFILTAAATIIFDLITAVLLGIAAAAVFALTTLSRSSGVTEQQLPDNDIDDAEESALLHDHIAVYRLDGALFFGAAQRFLDDLADVADVRVVILRMSQVQMLDATGAHALVEVVADLEDRGIYVVVKGLSPKHQRLVESVLTAEARTHPLHLSDSLDGAVAEAREVLAS